MHGGPGRVASGCGPEGGRGSCSSCNALVITMTRITVRFIGSLAGPAQGRPGRARGAQPGSLASLSLALRGGKLPGLPMSLSARLPVNRDGLRPSLAAASRVAAPSEFGCLWRQSYSASLRSPDSSFAMARGMSVDLLAVVPGRKL